MVIIVCRQGNSVDIVRRHSFPLYILMISERFVTVIKCILRFSILPENACVWVDSSILYLTVKLLQSDMLSSMQPLDNGSNAKRFLRQPIFANHLFSFSRYLFLRKYLRRIETLPIHRRQILQFNYFFRNQSPIGTSITKPAFQSISTANANSKRGLIRSGTVL